MLKTRILPPDDYDRVVNFYRLNNYQGPLSPADTYLIAELDRELCGAVRLYEEDGDLHLRSMRVRPDMQRQGIGTQLLCAFASLLEGRPCWVIPYRHLEDFYAQVGFTLADETSAPALVQARLQRYRQEFGLDVILMRSNQKNS